MRITYRINPEDVPDGYEVPDSALHYAELLKAVDVARAYATINQKPVRLMEVITGEDAAVERLLCTVHHFGER